MDPLVTSTLINTGANFLGGVLGKKKKGPTMQDMINGQIQLQRKSMMQSMADADTYGINKLAMLGINPTPQLAGGFGGSENDSTGDAIANLGQGLSRAYDAYSTQGERQLGLKSAQLGVENQELQNERLRSEIALMRTGGTVGFPTATGGPLAGQGDTQVLLPAENTKGSLGGPHGQGGAIPDIGYVRTSPNRLDIVPSTDMKQRMEDDIFQQTGWHLRNSLPVISNVRRSFFTPPPYPHEIPPPSGYKSWVWAYDHWKPSKKERR